MQFSSVVELWRRTRRDGYRSDSCERCSRSFSAASMSTTLSRSARSATSEGGTQENILLCSMRAATRRENASWAAS